MPTFLAIDFETSDYGRDSVCAVAMVRVKGTTVIERTFSYIRPPRKKFEFTYLHGISWSHVAGALTFKKVWPLLRRRLAGVDFIAAHNAGFDRAVMRACCEQSGLKMPENAFLCTMRLARSIWGIYPTKLPDVCGYLKIPLRHHEPGSDAEACAKIVIAAIESGRLDKYLKGII